MKQTYLESLRTGFYIQQITTQKAESNKILHNFQNARD